MSNVVKFDPVVVGEGYRYDGKEILEAAMDQTYDRMVVIGELDSGELYIAGTANAGESLILIERAKHFIVHGE